MDERGSGESEQDGGGMHCLVGEVVVMGEEDETVKVIVEMMEMMEDGSMERALGWYLYPLAQERRITLRSNSFTLANDFEFFFSRPEICTRNPAEV